MARAIPSPVRSDAPASATQARVLVVDDGAEVRELYCAYLNFHGFLTDCAEDGAAGLAKAFATRPDAIVLDYSMPRMDGEQVLMHLREDRRTRSIPVLLVTAVPELVGSRARDACTAFLEKPCEPDRLVSTLTEVLQHREAPRSYQRLGQPAGRIR